MLTVKIIEWSKSIDYFGLSIEAGPPRVNNKNVFFLYLVYTKPFVCELHIARHHLDKEFNLQPRNLCLYQLTKNISVGVVSHVYSALRDLQLGKILLLFS